MKRFLSMALCIVMALGILAGCGQKGNDTPKNDDNSTALSGTVSTNGSTSMDKVIGALKEQFTADNPGVTVTYDPTGSGAGIEAVKNGSADIGLASRALKDQEKSAGLQETTVALDGIAIIVNAGSKVADLTVQQIADIFTGKITDWSEVGGDPGAISCIGRESGSGTRDGFESITDTIIGPNIDTMCRCLVRFFLPGKPLTARLSAVSGCICTGVRHNQAPFRRCFPETSTLAGKANVSNGHNRFNDKSP